MEGKDAYAELSSIRDLMERSSKFISLSGLSGVLAGIYALAGAGLAYTIITDQSSSGTLGDIGPMFFSPLVGIALAVLVLSLVTSYWLTARKAKKRNEHIWNPVSRRLLIASGIPFFTGGLFIAILLWKGEHIPIASACLIFYGLALVAGSQYTYQAVKWLGIGEILLGLVALIYPGNGLLLWALGFGVLHIVYGIFMHFKYER
jgi:phosphate/sulfate permease